jgi:hypothetical protein
VPIRPNNYEFDHAAIGEAAATGVIGGAIYDA